MPPYVKLSFDRNHQIFFIKYSIFLEIFSRNVLLWRLRRKNALHFANFFTSRQQISATLTKVSSLFVTQRWYYNNSPCRCQLFAQNMFANPFPRYCSAWRRRLSLCCHRGFLRWGAVPQNFCRVNKPKCAKIEHILRVLQFFPCWICFVQ